MLFRTPVFALTAAAVLALGMGASTAVFTVAERLLLSPLPYPDSGRQVWISNVPPRTGAGLRDLFLADIDEIRTRSHSFASIGAA